jgi:glutamate-1-semialdehyde 2,1-aminomutase
MEEFKLFFYAMLDEGVYLAPSAYEAGFLSIEHNDSVIEKMLVAAKAAFSKI